MPSPSDDPAARRAVRDELLRHGLPLVLGPRDRMDGLVARCAPVLVALVLAATGLGLTATRLMDMSPSQQAAPSVEDALWIGAGMLLLVLAPLGWWLAWWLTHRRAQSLGTALSIGCLAALAVLPLLPTTGRGLSWAGLLIAVLLVAGAAYGGVGSMTAWAARRSVRELARLGAMVARVLPILMITLLFSFYNAEIWQVVAQLSMARTWAAVAVISALGIALAAVTAHDEVSRLVREHDLGTGQGELRAAERANITLVCVLITVIQVVLLAVVVILFYLAFGVLSISPVTAGQWIGAPPAHLGGLMARLPLTRPLLQVCLILGAFSAVNFAASTAADPMYRKIFLDPALDEVRQGLAIRNRYVAARSTAHEPAAHCPPASPPGPHPTGDPRE